MRTWKQRERAEEETVLPFGERFNMSFHAVDLKTEELPCVKAFVIRGEDLVPGQTGAIQRVGRNVRRVHAEQRGGDVFLPQIGKK